MFFLKTYKKLLNKLKIKYIINNRIDHFSIYVIYTI